MCDFWARVRIRKRTVETLTTEMKESISECNENGAISLEEAIQEFWKALGVTNMNRLCNEDPDLYAKIEQVEAQVRL
ncbi:MAG: hypothetical protein ACW968_03225 [Candidatus Thorarchaeota archaeon]|jgi:hypothetical protein